MRNVTYLIEPDLDSGKWFVYDIDETFLITCSSYDEAHAWLINYLQKSKRNQELTVYFDENGNQIKKPR